MTCTLHSIVAALDAEALFAPPEWEQRSVQTVFASDLISEILVSDGESPLLLSSLQSDQLLRAADMIAAAAVVLVNRRQIPAALIDAARRQGIPLFHTALPAFEACVRIGRLQESA